MNKQNRYPLPQGWPDLELPLPRVRLWRLTLSSDGWLIPEGLTGGYLDQPPPELHLREMRDVSTSDPAALRDLCQEVGEPLLSANPAIGVVGRAARPHLAIAHAQAQADNAGNQLGLPPANWGERPPLSVHVREVALRVEYTRLLVQHARLALLGQPTAPVWQRAGFFHEDAVSVAEEAIAEAAGFAALGDERPETVAWARFSGLLNDGLAELSPRLLGLDIESEPDVSDVASSYAAACSRIFNDLRERRPYKVCADETCRRIFRRQLGRSEGKNRPRSTGVEYCTWSHARNQSRRERRREARDSRGAT